MDNNRQSEGDVRQARRRLIKGSFAVPASTVLISGSAFAAVSTQCVRNAAQGAANPAATAAPGDLDGGVAYLRVRAYRAIDPTNNNVLAGANASSWVKGSELAMLVPSGNTAMPGTGSFEVVSAGSSTGFTVGTRTPSPPPLEAAATGEWYAVKVDAQGNILGLAPVDTAGGAVAQTCWVSFVTR